MITKIMKRIHLNLRVLGLIAKKRWLKNEDIGQSYTSLSHVYNTNWLCHLRAITNQLLQSLPEYSFGTILDLGCGTGYSTAQLSQKYPNASITGIDISTGMLQEAQNEWGNHSIAWKNEDMLQYLRNYQSNSIDLVFSGWAIGYSRPASITKYVSQVLRPHGVFAFVVNYIDTLAPVFRAFRSTMRAFPARVEKIIIPRFPRNRSSVQRMLIRNGFDIILIDEGEKIVKSSLEQNECILPWLLRTGILAGFDKSLPFATDHEIAAFFENEIRNDWTPLSHHYILAIGQKHGSPNNSIT